MVRAFLSLLVGVAIAFIVVDKYAPNAAPRVMSAAKAFLDGGHPGSTDGLVAEATDSVNRLAPSLPDHMADKITHFVGEMQRALPNAPPESITPTLVASGDNSAPPSVANKTSVSPVRTASIRRLIQRLAVTKEPGSEKTMLGFLVHEVRLDPRVVEPITRRLTLSQPDTESELDLILTENKWSIDEINYFHEGLSRLSLKLGNDSTPTSTTDGAEQPAFVAGHTDRFTWESWFAGLTGDFKMGADDWASRRSLPNPGSCNVRDRSAAFVAGCVEAKRRLAPTDARRKAELGYKEGWNSPVDAPAPSSTSARSSQAGYETVNSPADGFLNLRNAPHANADIIEKLPQGTSVRIIETFENGWQKVAAAIMRDTAHAPPEELVGFVNGKFLSQAPSTEKPAASPVASVPVNPVPSVPPLAPLVTAAVPASNITTYACFGGPSNVDRRITIDSTKKIVHDGYRQGGFFCEMTYSDGIKGPIASASTCNIPFAGELLSKAISNQSVSFRREVVIYGGLIVTYPIPLADSERNQFNELNLTTGVLAAWDGSRLNCRLLSRADVQQEEDERARSQRQREEDQKRQQREAVHRDLCTKLIRCHEVCTNRYGHGPLRPPPFYACIDACDPIISPEMSREIESCAKYR